jgi:hypothetical protein
MTAPLDASVARMAGPMSATRTNQLATGAAAGLLATVPMTAAMVAMHRRLPAWQRYALPPRRITMRAAGKVGLRSRMDEPHRTAATLAAHFGYGAAVGALLGAFAPRGPARAAAAGAGFGLLVWAASYLGLMPALDLHPPATRDTARRNALMVLAHLLWGASAGAVHDALWNAPRTRADRLPHPPRELDVRHAGARPRRAGLSVLSSSNRKGIPSGAPLAPARVVKYVRQSLLPSAQTLTVQSLPPPPVASVLPSGENATDSTRPV